MASSQARTDDCRSIRLCCIEPSRFMPPAVTQLFDQVTFTLVHANMNGREIFLNRKMSKTVNSNLALEQQTTGVLYHPQQILAYGLRADIPRGNRRSPWQLQTG